MHSFFSVCLSTVYNTTREKCSGISQKVFDVICLYVVFFVFFAFNFFNDNGSVAVMSFNDVDL